MLRAPVPCVSLFWKQRCRELEVSGSRAFSPRPASPGIPRLSSLDSAVAEDDDVEDEPSLGQIYGEGLAVLLAHLAAARRPQVQAWLQLKEDLIKSDAAALDSEQGWDDLNDLEADFIVTSEQHRSKGSWLVA